MKKFKEYLPFIVTVFLFLMFISQCSFQRNSDRRFKNIEDELKETKNSILTESDLEKVILWKTLELEEISDKNRIPINKLKLDYEKK